MAELRAPMTVSETQQALARYAELTRLWADADPPYRPQLQAAQRRLAALGGKP
jgi:hypothetical protein